jgi:release factor glutamine methyltransferase
MYFNQLNYNIQLYIASKVLNRTKEDLMIYSFDVTLEMENIAKNHIVNYVPLSKIFNEKYFWKNCFYTNEYTLDPRPETESLIELIISHEHDNVSLLELGVGTGAVILSLMQEIRTFRAIGIDISIDALEVCRCNADSMNLSPILMQNDWLNGFDEPMNILVSNPPYLLRSEIDENIHFLRYDPDIALYGGEDGMVFYKQIADKQHLFKYIYLEVPDVRKQKVMELFKNHGNCYII